MKISFHPLVTDDLQNAISFYASQDYELAQEFSKEIKISIQRIKEYPYAWSKTYKGCRRCLTKKYPYGIIYQIKDHNTIIIYAIMHLKRKPSFWVKRLNEHQD